MCQVTHLHPFRFSIEFEKTDKYPARAVDVRVAFSCHTFTRERRADDGDAKPYHTGERKPRMFCEERYPLSVHLPEPAVQLPSTSLS